LTHENQQTMLPLAFFLTLSTTLPLLYPTQTIIAQTAQIFKSYEDPILGVSIQYPSDWTVSEEKDAVGFSPPESCKSLPLQGLTIDVNSLAPTITSLDQYIREKYSSQRGKEGVSLSLSDFTIQGIPAKKIVGTSDQPNLSLFVRWMDVVMIKDRTAYVLDYHLGFSNTSKAAVEQHFDSLLPTVQKK
jgi:hypothetical protein